MEFLGLLNRIAQTKHYNTWDAEFSMKEIHEEYKRQLDNRFTDVNFLELSGKELQELGFGRWSDETDLMLIPLYLYDYIKDGTVLTCFTGEKKKKGIDDIDLDTRFGCIAYGIFPIEQLTTNKD